MRHTETKSGNINPIIVYLKCQLGMVPHDVFLSDETIDVHQRMPVSLTTIFGCDDVKMPVTYVD